MFGEADKIRPATVETRWQHFKRLFLQATKEACGISKKSNTYTKKINWFQSQRKEIKMEKIFTI